MPRVTGTGAARRISKVGTFDWNGRVKSGATGSELLGE